MSQVPLLQTIPAARFLERVQSAVFGEAISKPEAVYYRICTALMATTALEYVWAIPFFFWGQLSGFPNIKMVVYYAGLVVGITLSLSFEYISYKTVWGDRDVFQGAMSTICGVKTCVSRWWWKFLSFAPNYVAVVSSSYAAGTVYLANREASEHRMGSNFAFVWLSLVVLLIGSACIHFYLVGYWMSKVNGLPHPSSEQEAMHGLMAEACDAGNMQFIGVCFRTNAGDIEQRSRLAASVLVKLPLAFAKFLAIFYVFDVFFDTCDDELKKVSRSLTLAFALNMYGLMQLLPTFCRMLRKKPCSYCVPVAVLLLSLLSFFGAFYFSARCRVYLLASLSPYFIPN